MSAPKPATALPWREKGMGLGSTGARMEIRSAADGTGVCEYLNSEDTAYIVHACNHYPQLVAALRDLLEDADPHSPKCGSQIVARDLLRSLKEI